MRRSILIFTAALALLAAPAALAAPTCLNRAGDTVRCGVADAMPVGWTLPPEQQLTRLAAMDSGPSLRDLLGLVWVIGGLFTLIAVMPRFDGSQGSDWDRQEADDEG